MASLKELLGERANKFEHYKAIIDKKDSEKRDYTAEELGQLDILDGELDTLTGSINSLTNAERHKTRLASLQSLMDDTIGRQTHSLEPGAKRGSDASVLKMLRPKLFGGDQVEELHFDPTSNLAKAASPDYVQKFTHYIRTGEKQLGMMVGDNAKGGYLAPPAFMAELIKFLDNNVVMRQISRTISMPGVVNLGVPTWDTDPNDADWTAEVPASDISEDTAARVGRRNFMPHLLTKLVKSSKMMLASSAIPVEPLLRDRLGYKFAITEEQAYMTGDGDEKPLGIYTAHADGITTARDTTCASTSAFTGDELMDLFYSLKGGYQQRATWVIHRDTLKRIRKLKDGQSQYLWTPGLAGGVPSTILDRPYVLSEYASNTYTTGLYVAVVGDFSNYWIVDALNLEIQSLMELFSLKNQVGFLGTKSTDGCPVLAEAFARLKLA